MGLTVNRWWALATAAGVLGLFAALAVHWVGWQRLLAPWRTVGVGVLLVVVFGQLCSYCLRALRLWLAEPRIRAGGVAAAATSLRLILLNNLANLLLPARTGEASFPLLLRRWFGIGLAEGTGTLLWLRLLDLQVLAVLALGVGLAGIGWLKGPALAALVAALFGVVAAAPLLRKRLLRALAPRTGRAAQLAMRVLRSVPDRHSAVLRDLVIAWAAWGVKLAVLAIAFAGFAGIGWPPALLGVIGGDLSTVLPLHTPGGFGTYEAGVLALLAPFAELTPALLAAAVNLHLLVLGIALGFGALAALGGRGPVPESSG